MINQFNKSVTVVMAVKNGERFLGAAIESLLASEQFIREILVVDGDSTDRSREIALGYPGVRVVPQVGKGISGAYNSGIKLAAGELIAFNSSDDLWSNHKLSRQLKMLEEKPELQFIVGLCQCFLEDPNFVPSGFRPELLEPFVAYNMEILLARRAAFERVGSFDEELTIAEDVDWFCRARELNVPAGVVNELLVRKRIHDNNIHLNKANAGFLFQVLSKSTQRKRQMALERDKADEQCAPVMYSGGK